jgi:gamma-glutamyl phosphate reductase
MPDSTDFPDPPRLDAGATPAQAWLALAELQAGVVEANQSLERAGSEDLWAARAADLPDRLRAWLENLYEALKNIVEAIGHATFSVTVGRSVSVSVTFENPAN